MSSNGFLSWWGRWGLNSELGMLWFVAFWLAVFVFGLFIVLDVWPMIRPLIEAVARWLGRKLADVWFGSGGRPR